MRTCEITWDMARIATEELYRRNHERIRKGGVWGVPRGGVFVKMLIREYLLLEIIGGSMCNRVDALVPKLTTEPEYMDTLIVDDLVDSGRTLEPWRAKGYQVDALFRKPHSPSNLAPTARLVEGWASFPWEPPGESQNGPEREVTRVLEWLGEDPTREGLRETPARVCRALKEMTSGAEISDKHTLAKRFEEPNDQMVVLRGVRFSSLCEHHLLPFTGRAAIGEDNKCQHL